MKKIFFLFTCLLSTHSTASNTFSFEVVVCREANGQRFVELLDLYEGRHIHGHKQDYPTFEPYFDIERAVKELSNHLGNYAPLYGVNHHWSFIKDPEDHEDIKFLDNVSFNRPPPRPKLQLPSHCQLEYLIVENNINPRYAKFLASKELWQELDLLSQASLTWALYIILRRDNPDDSRETYKKKLRHLVSLVASGEARKFKPYKWWTLIKDTVKKDSKDWSNNLTFGWKGRDLLLPEGDDCFFDNGNLRCARLDRRWDSPLGPQQASGDLEFYRNGGIRSATKGKALLANGNGITIVDEATELTYSEEGFVTAFNTEKAPHPLVVHNDRLYPSFIRCWGRVTLDEDRVSSCESFEGEFGFRVNTRGDRSLIYLKRRWHGGIPLTLKNGHIVIEGYLDNSRPNKVLIGDDQEVSLRGHLILDKNGVNILQTSVEEGSILKIGDLDLPISGKEPVLFYENEKVKRAALSEDRILRCVSGESTLVLAHQNTDFSEKGLVKGACASE